MGPERPAASGVHGRPGIAAAAQGGRDAARHRSRRGRPGAGTLHGGGPGRQHDPPRPAPLSAGHWQNLSPSMRPSYACLFIIIAAAPIAAGPAELAAQSAAVMDTGARAGEANAKPLVIGETFTIDSRVLGELRRINVYRPGGHASSPAAPLPVLYMPDGGIGEDFLHVAGLVQVSVGNGTMRPFLLVGIENTARRRDLTGPTSSAED